MARVTVEMLEEQSQCRMKSFFDSLSEKDRRRYAAVEAERLGPGGIRCVAQILGCSTRTISRGIDELDSLHDDPAAGRVRRLDAALHSTGMATFDRRKTSFGEQHS